MVKVLVLKRVVVPLILLGKYRAQWGLGLILMELERSGNIDV